ncbi:hypothetical protein HNO92_003345 [Chromobacterium alkanivorans]|uniref:hypothetical protein n=1 Tax=Chromobacterium alkanivorans TaxID=1071719 RepID=UPI0019672CEE|nr:hypothetical protein [Chromobacterium alkanivorans]MBN3004286.1 hypothetical protein [Chromobacterium alkanivorans]MCS3805917.1 hypothetical protein [Chromobacterium alkanivorans]MCS3820255.1 hypothetical protein [Chromobacterium alkanivorans]MCS3875013.1 hypothetical protein [Chromobacterium alkanivorans]
MRHNKLAWLFNYLARTPSKRQDETSCHLNVICDIPVITALRKQLFWEMHTLGLAATHVTITPASAAGQACLSVRLDCPVALRRAFNEMALRLSKMPEIHRVRWGRRKPETRATPRRWAASA